MLKFDELLSNIFRLFLKMQEFGALEIWKLRVPGDLEICNQISGIWNWNCSKSEMRAQYLPTPYTILEAGRRRAQRARWKAPSAARRAANLTGLVLGYIETKFCK